MKQGMKGGGTKPLQIQKYIFQVLRNYFTNDFWGGSPKVPKFGTVYIWIY